MGEYRDHRDLDLDLDVRRQHFMDVSRQHFIVHQMQTISQQLYSCYIVRAIQCDD